MLKQPDNLIVDEIKREVAEHVRNLLNGGFVIKVDGVYTSVITLQVPNRPLDTRLTIETDQGLRHFTVHVMENYLNEDRARSEGKIL